MHTALYAALLGLIMLALAIGVVRKRRTLKVGLGVGDHPELEKAVRAHANFVEYVPMALVMLSLYEAQGAPGWAIHLLGAALVIARLLHAQGLYQSRTTSFGRFFGTLVTWLVLVALSALLLINAVMALL